METNQSSKSGFEIVFAILISDASVLGEIFFLIFSMCLLTVRWLMHKIFPISLLVRPLDSSRSMPTSREVSESIVESGACVEASGDRDTQNDTSCADVCKSNFLDMLLRCFWTVNTVTRSSAAMCAVGFPSAINATICASRFVRFDI
jgi:hypothetical protein